MLRRVRHAARHHPGAGPRNIEEGNGFLPPGFRLGPQYGQTLGAVFGISRHEFPTHLARRQRRRAHIDAQNFLEPEILTHALMDHLLVDAASTWIGSIGTDRQLVVAEHTPDADHFHALGGIAVDEEAISHRCHRIWLASSGTSTPALKGTTRGV